MDLMSKYHGLMKQVTLEVNKQLSSVLQDNLSSHEMERFSQMVDIKKPELKILMIRCAYEICGGQDWQSALSAVSGIQSIIFGCYLNNMLVYKGEEIDSQEGEHRAIKELSHALIHSGHHILEEAPIEPVKGLARHFVSNYFASMNMLADKLKVGNVSTFDDFENYLETYSMFLIFYI